MRLICPCCGGTFSLEIALNDADARQSVARAMALPAGLSSGLLRYLGMFRPAQRSLPWPRVAKLLDELLAMIDAGQIQRNGRFWPAPIATWKAALDEIAERRSLELPLKSHGYLLEIIAGISNKAEAVAEAEQEKRRHAPREGVQNGMQGIGALLNNFPHPSPSSSSAEPVEAGLVEPPFDRLRARGVKDSPPRTPPSAAFLALKQKLMGTDNLASRAGETLEPPA
jgi:hypothetical protein